MKKKDKNASVKRTKRQRHYRGKTLDEILKEDAMKLHKFPPEKRANVATILASSLLQLQRTHWLKDNWTRKYIFFVMRDDKPVFDEPYFSQDFMSSKSHPETASTPPQP